MTIGVPLSERICRQTSIPSVPGSIRSSRTRSGLVARKAAIARSPSATNDGSKPSVRRTMPSISASAGSSSTTSTRPLLTPLWSHRNMKAAAVCEDAAMSEWTSPGGQSPQTGPPPSDSAPSDWAPSDSATPAPAWGAPPPGWDRPYAATAPRPGIIPLRPLGVGELLDGAFTAMRRYPRATLGLSAIIAAVQQLLGLVVDLATNDVATPDSTGLSGVGTVSGVIVYLVNAALGALL